jgi:predicted Zn-dependent peptidase
VLKFIPLVFLLSFSFAHPLPAQTSDVFPYDYKIEELENGLKVVSVPLSNPNIIAFYTVVRAGSRNEVEPGKSGFAHFFEHMMFKGTKTVPRPAYDEFLTRLGAGTNGFTSDDHTIYFVVFAGRDNLEEVVKTEADRFINLYYDEEMLKTEAPVIEGEYYASVSNPGRRLAEVLRDTAFVNHSYRHTTLGYLKDILDMPNQFEYSRLFKKRFYAPDNILLLVAILEQKCQTLYASFPDRRDPHLLTFQSVVKKEDDLPYVEEQIFQELEKLKTEAVSAEALAEIKSNIKYSLANELGTTDGVAGTLIAYLSLAGDPGTLNKLFRLYERVTPQDIMTVAKKYFVKSNSTVATLSGGKAQ